MATIDLSVQEAQAVLDSLLAADRTNWGFVVQAVSVFNKLAAAFPVQQAPAPTDASASADAPAPADASASADAPAPADASATPSN